jgi:hypothetical protein
VEKTPGIEMWFGAAPSGTGGGEQSELTPPKQSTLYLKAAVLHPRHPIILGKVQCSLKGYLKGVAA